MRMRTESVRSILPALSVALLAAPSVLAQGPTVRTEVEPNGTVAEANEFAVGDEVICNLTAGETDWFRFTVTQAGRIDLITFGNTTATGTTQTDTSLELFDSTGTTSVGWNDDMGGSGNFCGGLHYNLQPGTYTLKVTGSGATDSGVYKIDCSWQPLKTYTNTETEPNDAYTAANVIGSVTNWSVNGAIGVDGDVDFYQITIPTTTGLWFMVTDGEVPALRRSRLEFYTSAGALIGTTLGTNNANSGSFTGRVSTIRTWPAGTYYVAVKKDSGVTTPSTGNYRLECRYMVMNSGSDITETEPNNTVANLANIKTLLPGQRGVGLMSTGSSSTAERDLWRFQLAEPSTVQFQTTSGLTTPVLADTTIRLMNSDGSYGGIQALSGNTLAPTGSSHGRSTVRFNLTPGTYFLEVFGGTTTVSGNYTLEVGVMPSIYVDASYALVTVNATCLGTNTLRPTIAIEDFFTTRERPVLGAYFRRTVKDMPANAPYFFVQGFTTSAIATGNGGTTPLPLDLTSLGAVGCSLNVDIQNLRLGVANALGRSEQGEVLTTNPVFRGLPVYEQAVVLDPTAPGNTLGVTFSNYARQILGDRHWM